MTLRRILIACVFALASVRSEAQIDPSATWRTIQTAHFRVHYEPEVERQGRAAAAAAERAYTQLSADLPRPRGPIDIVVNNAVDYSNSYTTPFPTNRIVINAYPPLDEKSLQLSSEWISVVVTHELTHIFHFDQAGGWWRLAQHVFGRNPLLMPNTYAPSWFTEGLAVYYESALTGSGRLVSSEHRMIARADAAEGRVPNMPDLRGASTRFPYGQSSYAYGSLLFEDLQKYYGREAIGRFVRLASAEPFPFRTNHAAEGAFGQSLTSVWHRWFQSAERDSAQDAPLNGWRQLTTSGAYARHPRWLNDTLLVFAADDGRDQSGAYTVDTVGRVVGIGRRNEHLANVPLRDGSLVYAQLEFIDAYHVRADLYRSRAGNERRLTNGARLRDPDGRADGSLLAVQAVGGTNRVVRLDTTDSRPRPLTTAASDTLWAAPRWSPDGTRIAAIRTVRGDRSDLVLLDTLGVVIASLTDGFAGRGSLISSLSWFPDGRRIAFVSDRSGSAQIYEALVAVSASADGTDVPVSTVRQLSQAKTGIFDVAVSPDGSRLAATVYRSDGYHIGIAPATENTGELVALESVPPPSELEATPVTVPSKAYSPWASLIPRYWVPLAYSNTGSQPLIGAATSGRDIVGRHAYTVQLLTGTDRRWASWSGNYTFSGLSKPILSLAANRTNDERVAGNADGELAGTMLHRATNLAATATFLRNRIRVFSFLSVSAEKQQETFTPEDTPDSTLQPVLPISSRQYTGLTVIGSWSNTQRPIKAISFEDGVLAQGRLRQRWMAAGPNSGLPSFEGLIHGYKSLTRLGLPNHVVAIRIAGAYSDDRLGSPFSIGGGRSAALNVIDGFVLQNVERPYFIRGTPDGVQSGSRAVTVSAEYRWPMFAPSRGLGLFPAFLDRVSGSIFADAGHAWCSKAAVSSCQSQAGGVDNTWAQAVGAELSLSSAFLRYDTITQLRLGIASSISPATRGLRAPQVYAALGIPF